MPSYIEDIVKLENNNNSTTIKKNLKIVTNSMTAIQAIKELKISEGNGSILLLFNGQNIKIGEKFQINDILAEKLRKIPEIISVDLY